MSTTQHSISPEKQEEIIAATIEYVKSELATAEAGHDWLHIQRVYSNALAINREEKADHLIISLGALLHDIADSKFHNGDEEIGPHKARTFLASINVCESVINEVISIMENMSYHSTLGDGPKYTSHELCVVQDADRLDAIGAIGIGRCFTYGGYKNRALYDPNVKPNLNMSKEEYKASTSPTINHFYEKLLLLKDLMNTPGAKRLANDRHAFMLSFLDQFHAEIEGSR